MGAGVLGRFGDSARRMIGRGTQYGEFAGKYFAQGVALGNVHSDLGDGGRGFEAIQLLLRTIDDRDGIVAGPAQQFRNHGSNLARTYDNDVFHAASLKMAAILNWGPYEW